MPPYAGPAAARPGEIAGTLRLLAYLAAAFALIVLDHRGGWLSNTRQQAQVFVQPLWSVAGWPGKVVDSISDDAGTRSSLMAENRRLRNELLVSGARMARLQAASADNDRLRSMLGVVKRGGLDVQLARILDIDLDPVKQRLVLDAGSGDGVRVGQVVIDAGGVVGQVIAVTPMHSTALLLTDPDHAVPVAVLRNGVRLVAYGSGRSDRLSLASIPLSSDVKVGDVVVTSGLGDRFPAGFPVGTISALRPDESRAFLVGDVTPAAQLDRGRDVLLLRSAPARPVIGPVAESTSLLPVSASVAAPATATLPASAATRVQRP
ncbi:rod shape-determining protein MreC [Noviluteimonas lactosilytica]|uniref:rod shape-determining protein MreC n=1 Tax=Noviluteimonas lactosilytica TaxID=2888523 RepID=UPI003CCD4144